MTVATAEYTLSSTIDFGLAVTPGGVFVGGRIVNDVATVVNGGASSDALIRLVLGAHDGPPHTAAMALPSLSSCTSNCESPSFPGVNGGAAHDSVPRHALLSCVASIITNASL